MSVPSADPSDVSHLMRIVIQISQSLGGGKQLSSVLRRLMQEVQRLQNLMKMRQDKPPRV
jgi:hypothetical protein